MSGVYINMEMPSGCDDCYFCGEMGICSVLVATHINSGIVGEYRYSEFERPPFCPLVPVPDHGRLVDADALSEEHRVRAHQGMSENSYSLHTIARAFVNDAPTILPGEEDRDV